MRGRRRRYHNKWYRGINTYMYVLYAYIEHAMQVNVNYVVRIFGTCTYIVHVCIYM